MDKVIQEWLEQNGYKVDGYAIIDSEGNSVEDIETPYGTEGGISQNHYNILQEKKKHLEEGGFDFKGQDFNSTIRYNSGQVDKFINKKKITDFKEGKTKQVPDFSNPAIKTAFEKMQEENKASGKGYYDSPEDFINGKITIVESPSFKNETTEIIPKKDSGFYNTIAYTSLIIIAVIVLYCLKNRIIYISKKINMKGYNIKTLVIALIISTLLGFSFKKYNHEVLKGAIHYYKISNKSGEAFLSAVDNQTSFFSLKSSFSTRGHGYYYNWTLFVVSFVFIIAISYLLKTTVLGDKVIEYWNSIKKK